MNFPLDKVAENTHKNPMQASLVFNLPEDQEEFDTYQCAPNYKNALVQIDRLLRDTIKYGPNNKTIEDIRADFLKILEEERVELY